jgi:DNA transformation protein
MAVSENYRSFILEQLTRALGDARARSMFGGVGVYRGELFFALMDDDALYFKVDEDTQGDFEARGMGPFRPFGDGGDAMRYYEVPADVIEDQEALRGWAQRALSVARRARTRKPRGARRPG